MNFKVIEWVKNFLDNKENRNYRYYSVYSGVIAILVVIISELAGFDSDITIAICFTALLAIGLFFQIFRNDRNLHSILYYLLGTIFIVFMTVMIYLSDMYLKQNNMDMGVFFIKIFVCGIVTFMDLIGIFFILYRGGSKYKKVIMSIIMITITLIAIATATLLPPKG